MKSEVILVSSSHPSMPEGRSGAQPEVFDSGQAVIIFLLSFLVGFAVARAVRD